MLPKRYEFWAIPEWQALVVASLHLSLFHYKCSFLIIQEMSLNWAFPATINATGRNIHQRIGKGTLPSAKGVLLNNEYLGKISRGLVKKKEHR